MCRMNNFPSSNLFICCHQKDVKTLPNIVDRKDCISRTRAKAGSEAGIYPLKNKEKYTLNAITLAIHVLTVQQTETRKKTSSLFDVHLHEYCIYVSEKEKIILYFIEVCISQQQKKLCLNSFWFIAAQYELMAQSVTEVESFYLESMEAHSSQFWWKKKSQKINAIFLLLFYFY